MFPPYTPPPETIASYGEWQSSSPVPVASELASTPTTKLEGEALMGVTMLNLTDSNRQINIGQRLRLNIDASFNSQDRLRVRLQAANLEDLGDITGTNMTRFSFQGSSDNQVELSRLEYMFPVGQQTTVFAELVGGSLNDFTNTLNPFLSGSSRGSISRFGQRNPIYRLGEGAGIGLSHKFNGALSLQLGYLAEDAPQTESGFTGGAYGTIAQLTFQPREGLGFGFTYGRSLNSLSTRTGSSAADDPFADQSNRVLADAFGFQSSLRVNKRLTVGGWLGYTRARALDLPDQPRAEILNWAVTLAFPNTGGKGHLLGVVIGQPPKLISNQFQVDRRSYVDSATALHLEAFYRRQLSPNLAMTFGMLAITHPEHEFGNPPAFVGTFRTVFSF
jgi:Carbohydrate-selective porin, OprB family